MEGDGDRSALLKRAIRDLFSDPLECDHGHALAPALDLGSLLRLKQGSASTTAPLDQAHIREACRRGQSVTSVIIGLPTPVSTSPLDSATVMAPLSNLEPSQSLKLRLLTGIWPSGAVSSSCLSPTTIPLVLLLDRSRLVLALQHSSILLLCSSTRSLLSEIFVTRFRYRMPECLSNLLATLLGNLTWLERQLAESPAGSGDTQEIDIENGRRQESVAAESAYHHLTGRRRDVSLTPHVDNNTDQRALPAHVLEPQSDPVPSWENEMPRRRPLSLSLSPPPSPCEPPPAICETVCGTIYDSILNLGVLVPRDASERTDGFVVPVTAADTAKPTFWLDVYTKPTRGQLVVDMPQPRIVRRRQAGPFEQYYRMGGYMDGNIAATLQNLPAYISEMVSLTDCRTHTAKSVTPSNAVKQLSEVISKESSSIEPPRPLQLVHPLMIDDHAVLGDWRPPTCVSEGNWAFRWKARSNRGGSVKYDVQLSTSFVHISTRGAVTGWHVDFEGTAFVMAPLAGVKRVYFCEPTYANIARALQSEASLQPVQYEVSSIRAVTIGRGDVLIVPGGWPHAVETFEDSLMVSSNLYHSWGIPVQLAVYGATIIRNPEEKRSPFSRYCFEALSEFSSRVSQEGKIPQHKHLVSRMQLLCRWVKQASAGIARDSGGEIAQDLVLRQCALVEVQIDSELVDRQVLEGKWYDQVF